ncbi:MAG: hypothetical protein IK059_03505 [Firmicutes bacterium]|nr:hypothetical protein [Bacillota bacterium]
MEILAKRGISTFLIKVEGDLYCRLRLYPQKLMVRPLEADNPNEFLKEKYYEAFDGNEEETNEIYRIMRLWGYVGDEDTPPLDYNPSRDYVASLNKGK